MNMSPEARGALIEAYEGLRLTSYRDGGGIWTIGYGHTTAAGAPMVKREMELSAAEADELLARDLARVERGVANVLHRAALQREFDAFVDFAFNVGLGSLRSSTLLRLFNQGQTSRAADAFLAWNRSRGRSVPGLTRRREAERAWFLSGSSATLRPVSSPSQRRVDRPDPVAARVANRLAYVVSKVRGGAMARRR